MLVGFEEGADVHGLTAPDVTVDGPVEGELERTAVEGAARRMVSWVLVTAHGRSGELTELACGQP